MNGTINLKKLRLKCSSLKNFNRTTSITIFSLKKKKKKKKTIEKRNSNRKLIKVHACVQRVSIRDPFDTVEIRGSSYDLVPTRLQSSELL